MALNSKQRKRLKELEEIEQNFIVSSRQAPQIAGGDPERIGQPTDIKGRIGAGLPILGAVGGAVLGGLPGAIAGGSLGETGRQKFLGEPLSPGRIALEGGLSALGVGGTGQVGKALLPAVRSRLGRKAATTIAQKTGAGVAIGKLTGVGRQTGTQIAKTAGRLPELSATNLEKVGKNLIDAAAEMKQRTNTAFGKAIQKETARVGKQGIVPKTQILDLFQQTKKTLGIDVPGAVPGATAKVERKLRTLETRVVKQLANIDTVNPQNLLNIRTQITDTLQEVIKEGGINKSAFEQLRVGMNNVIQKAHPAIRAVDQTQAAKFEVLQEMKRILGIDPNATKLTNEALEKLETNLSKINKSPIRQRAFEALDEALPAIDNLVDDLKELSAAQAVSQNRIGIGRFAAISGLGSAGAAALFGGPVAAGAVATPFILLTATDPKFIAAGLRTLTRGIAEIPGQIGVRQVSELARQGIEAFREPRETDPGRIQETKRLSSQLGLTGQQELRKVPGTDISRSLSGNLLVSTPKAQIPVDAPLEKAFLQNRPLQRSRAIGR